MQIKRHLPPFIRDVTLSDFQAVSGLSYISQSGKINSRDPWNQYVLLSPSQIFKLVTAELPGVPSVSLSLDDHGALMIDLMERDDLYFDGRQIDLQDGTLDNGSVEVKKSKRSGVGKKLVRNYIELGVHLNCHGMNILAGDKDGAYFWARAGIPLKYDSSHYVTLKKQLDTRLENIAHMLDPETYDEAKELIQLDDIYSINKIAYLSFVIYEDGNESASKLTIGHYLLNGLMYEGYLDFSDSHTMTHIESFVGGFNFIRMENSSVLPEPMALTA